MNASPNLESPKWSATVKMVIGLSFMALAAALIIRFQNLIGPLLMVFIFTYLLHPVASKISNATRLSWRASVGLIFILLLIFLLSSFTALGVVLIQQFESLFNVVQRFVVDLPDFVRDLALQTYVFGPFSFSFAPYLDINNLELLVEDVIALIQPVLGRAGGILSTVASGTATTLGWLFFTIIVSYFVLADLGKVPDALTYIKIPGYDADIKRIGRELGRIWNAFLRGQIFLFTLTVIVFSILLSILGLRYAFGLAMLAGFARFVPYVGPWVTWIVTALVAIFQKSNYLGMEGWQYALLVVIIAVVIDQIFDQVISPRFLGQTLGVHPAAVLVAAIIAASLIGLIGVVLAAPVLASLVLIGRYTSRKLLDLDPFPDPESDEDPVKISWDSVQEIIKKISSRLKRRKDDSAQE